MNQHTSLDSSKVGFTLLVIGLFAPAGVNIGSAPFPILEGGVTSMLWYIGYSHEYGIFTQISPFYNPSIFYRPEHVLFFITISLLAFVPRFIFVYQMIRRYNGMSNRKRTLILGVLSESIFILLFILTLFTTIYQLIFRSISISLFFPIPTLLFSGFALLKYRPAPEPAIPWRELNEPKQW